MTREAETILRASFQGREYHLALGGFSFFR
jgi:hypothetical protein